MRNCRSLTCGALATILCATVLGATPALAQVRALGEAPFGHMRMLFERTIFNVDVLTLDVCFDAPTAAGIAEHARDGRTDAGDDAIAAAAIDAMTALGRIQFRRNISLGQFLGGIRDEQRKAVRAGLLADSTYRLIGDSLPVWFDFLDERGIHTDDQIVYVFSSDSLRTVYRDRDGSVLLDRIDVGEQRRTSVIATWLAPGSDFREPLLRSLDPDGRTDPAACVVPDNATGGGQESRGSGAGR
ncbi:MAG TPA: hypothetical protein VMM79_01995 [Longimicrobiales bacterium]|nr:hypothetical protein [Longimicrobiales bacterium]